VVRDPIPVTAALEKEAFNRLPRIFVFSDLVLDPTVLLAGARMSLVAAE
jgi:hypothetical protein